MRWTGVASSAILLTLFNGVPALSDDLRVLQLESEVRRLQRELDTQARRIAELERRVRTDIGSRSAAGGGQRADSSPAWLVSTNWERIRRGMTAVEVIALLGRPTSVRNDSEDKIQSFWYALELGPTAVLSGSVELDGKVVTAVNKPVLR